MTPRSRYIYSEASVQKNHSHIRQKFFVNICNSSKVSAV